VFPENVRYGDIVNGLPLGNDSCDALYCSHVLEHLSLHDFRIALKNSYRILRPGGLFRCVVPDLEYLARNYLDSLNVKPDTASIDFIGRGTLLGTERRVRSMKTAVVAALGNSRHLWMWDHESLASELRHAGFKNVRRAIYNDSRIEAFREVEDPDRFRGAVALECTK
jgi:predicted SAM-dependent methyltransferase